MNISDYIDAGFGIVELHPMTKEKHCTCFKGKECAMAGKHPKLQNWQSKQYTEEELVAIEDSGPDSFGALVNGYLVIDIDPRNGGDEGYKQLCKDTNTDYEKESSFVVFTGGGGKHIYFKAPEGVQLKSKLGQYNGVDFKSSGFVVGAGSLHKTGLLYESIKGAPSDIAEPPKKLVELLEKKVNPKNSAFSLPDDKMDEQKIQDMLDCIDPDCDYEDWLHIGMAIHDETCGEGFDLWDAWSSNGSKYNQKEMDFKWHSFGKSPDPVTIGTLIRIAEDNGYQESVTFESSKPTVVDWDDNDPRIEKAIELAMINEAAERAQYHDAMSDLDFGIEESKEIVAQIKADKEDDSVTLEDKPKLDLTKPPGLVGEIADWINRRGHAPRKMLAVAAALQAVSNSCGIYWRMSSNGFNDLCPNLYMVCIAGSGTGKESIQNNQMAIQREMGLGGSMFGKIKSDKEMYTNLLRSQVNSYVIDEFASIMQKVFGGGKNTAAYNAGIESVLLQLFSKSGGRIEFGGDEADTIKSQLRGELAALEKKKDENEYTEYDEKKEKQILRLYENAYDGFLDDPFVSLTGYSTPTEFFKYINRSMVDSGFFARMTVVIEPEDNPRPMPSSEKILDKEIPESIKYKLLAACPVSNTDELPSNRNYRFEYTGKKKEITVTNEASELIDKLSEYYWLEAEKAKETDGLTGMYRRTVAMVLKVAMVLAIADGGKMTPCHLLWAKAFIEASDEVKSSVVSENESKEYKDKTGEAVAFVKRQLNKESGITAAELHRKKRSIKKEDFQSVLTHLESTGYAEKRMVKPKTGRPSEKFFKV